MKVIFLNARLQVSNQKDWVEIMPPRMPRMLWLAASSMASLMCRLGSSLPVFLMVSYLRSLLVSSSMRLPQSSHHLATFLMCSPLSSVVSSWSFSLSGLFHLFL